jgi:hypothetical protein
MCFSSVATALGASAGIEEFEPAIRFEEGDLRRRFPRLAAATEEERRHFSSGEGERALGIALEAFPDHPVQFFLLADALGIVSFLGRGRPRRFEPEGVMAMEQPLALVVPGRLGLLAQEVR